MSTAKERPILFSGPMVRAILEGRKTQTRRVVSPQPHGWSGTEIPVSLSHPGPYGRPGDRLWVRETWRVSTSGRHYPSRQTSIYAEWREQHVSHGRVRCGQQQTHWTISDDEHDTLTRQAYGPSAAVTWRPSIHMPRWASRLTLEVTEVRVQRLQDISEADILAEGVTVDRVAEWCNTPWDHMPDLHTAWRVLWDSINGARPGCHWEANPWTWCISFRVVPFRRLP